LNILKLQFYFFLKKNKCIENNEKEEIDPIALAETWSTKSKSSLSIPSRRRISGRRIGAIRVTAIRSTAATAVDAAVYSRRSVRVFDTLPELFYAAHTAVSPDSAYDYSRPIVTFPIKL
jgi:hypothetical protein